VRRAKSVAAYATNGIDKCAEEVLLLGCEREDVKSGSAVHAVTILSSSHTFGRD
jgi:hypothetical protein